VKILSGKGCFIVERVPREIGKSSGRLRGGAQGGLILSKTEITEGRKASRESKTCPPLPQLKVWIDH